MDHFSQGVAANKQQGTAGELLFAYESYRRGLYPAKPEGDPPCFDTLVTNRKTGKAMYVQTRTSIMKDCLKKTAPRWLGNRWQVKTTCNSGRTHISDAGVDVFAVYCVPICWYFLDARKIEANSVSFYPHNPQSKAKYEGFKENWGVFGFSRGDPVLLS